MYEFNNITESRSNLRILLLAEDISPLFIIFDNVDSSCHYPLLV